MFRKQKPHRFDAAFLCNSFYRKRRYLMQHLILKTLNWFNIGRVYVYNPPLIEMT